MKNRTSAGIAGAAFRRAAATAAVFALGIWLSPKSCAAEDWSRIYAAGYPAISADGAEVYFNWAGTNWVASSTGGVARTSPSFHPAFSPGRFSGEMHEAMASCPSVSPDGSRVVFRFRGDEESRMRRGTKTSCAGEIWLFDSNGRTFRRISSGDRDASHPVWLGDNAVAYTVDDSNGSREAIRHDLATGREETLLDGKDGAVSYLSSSKDGKTLLFRRGVDLWRADLGGGKIKTALLLFHPEKTWKRPPKIRKRWYDSVWNNDGGGSVSATTNGEDIVFTTGGDLWAVKPGKGTNEVRRLRGETKTHERFATVTRDGRHVYYLRDFGDRSEVWRMRRKDESKPWHDPGCAFSEERLVAGPDVYNDVKLSPDETVLSWTEFEGRLMMMPLGSRKIVEVTPPGTYLCCEYEWSPDGRCIAVAAADKDRNFDVWVVDVAAALKGRRKAVNVSDHFGWDGGPKWTADSRTLLFRGARGDSGNVHFKVDAGKKLSTGSAVVVKPDDLKKLKERLAKKPGAKMPRFKAWQDTSLDDYRELAFRIVVGRLRSRFLGGNSSLFDIGRIMRHKDAARHAATWVEFHRVVKMALGEIDASHLDFYSTKAAKKEWNIVVQKTGEKRAKKKVASTGKNREKVEKATGGKWSYIRLPAMDGEAYANFVEDLHRFGRGREGLVIDMRGNIGGSYADLMASSLMVPRHGWADWSRGRRGYNIDHMKRVQFYGKIVLVIDEGVFSNGEMFVHMMKTFKRATVVGRPTAGSVLSTTSETLLDLGEYRLPHGMWFNEEGVPMENHGAEPDIRVDDTPGEWFDGVDSQLEKAIEAIRRE